MTGLGACAPVPPAHRRDHASPSVENPAAPAPSPSDSPRIGLVPAAIDAAGRESVPLVTAWPANPATALPAASWSGAAFAPVGTV